MSIYELSRQLPELKTREETKWLKEVSAQALGNALMHLDAAYTGFFNGNENFPSFKRHGHGDSFENHQNNAIDFDTQCVRIRKFTEGIKGVFNRQFEGKIKTTTIKRTTTNKYYACVLVDDGIVEPAPVPAIKDQALGLDFGLKDLVVTSDGQCFRNPRTLKRYLRRLKIRQRRLSRATKGSNRQDKARHRVARVYETISNIRKDCLHKISHLY